MINQINYVELSCNNCGIIFFLSDKHVNTLRESKATFYCPNGHSLSYTGKSSSVIISELENKCKATEKRCEETAMEKKAAEDKMAELQKR